MTLRLTLIFHLYLLSYVSTFSSSYTLLYHTENSFSIQYYDCIYYKDFYNQSMKYCRQLSKNQSLQRDFNQSCHNNGQLWSFEELLIRNVSSSDISQWSSSMEQTDRYSKYLSNTSLDVGDKYICNCTNPTSFGKFCEYEFYSNTISFDDTITKQRKLLEDFNMDDYEVSVGSQLHSNRLCYITLECESGLMCLDWRHICDGKQQCMDGLDEDHCETLEFNECEDDEYRCANGMCIPEEYWLDADYDCMDWTDEMGAIVLTGKHCFNISSFICDEHLCHYNKWSCGDGHCVDDDTDRHEGILDGDFEFCQNMRDVQYMCESVTRASQSWWTIDGGYCLPYSLHYQTLGLDTTNVKNTCAFFMKCALSGSLDQDCPFKNVIACHNRTIRSCLDSDLFYPAVGPVLSPYVHMIYADGHDWTNKKPDIIVLYGRVKCIGYRSITNDGLGFEVTETDSFYDYSASENFLCNKAEETDVCHNYSGPHYDINCWNNSKTFNNRSYQVSFLCRTRCISKYRVRDGIHDCNHQNEEDYNINNSCPQIQHHRLQCSSSELTCLLAATLGDGFAHCSNKRDEFGDEIGVVRLYNIDCISRFDSRCTYLRNYIRMSSYDDKNRESIINNNTLDDHLTTSISFRSYCDSFFDTKSGFDELSEFCKKWICAIDEYQCLSGQCILQDWVCDGEWDCSDASDEQGIFILDDFDKHNSKLMNLTEIKEKCYEQYHSNNTPFFDICDLSSEYPCFRSNVDDPFNLTLNRPCINLTQIGDDKTDCLSALDERNRLQCPILGTLGFHFPFNDSYCGEYPYLCTHLYPWTRGTNVDYDAVCFHQEKLFKNGTASDCNTGKDVMCLNDVCIKDARCNGQVECLHGEDEYRCILQNKSQLHYRNYKKYKHFENLRLRNYPSSTQSLHTKSSFPPNDIDQHLLHSVSNRNSLLDLTTTFESVNHITTVYEKRNSRVKSVYETVRDSLPNGTITFEQHYLPFICNRGVAIKYYTGHTVCFCPPSFYGPQCEFYSDRITILTHLDLANYQSTFHQIAVIKVLVTFLFQNQIIDYYEFHVNPQLENDNNYIKQHIYFLYPRTERFIQMEKTNRNGTQLYSVQFEAFNLHWSEKIESIGVWKYPIYFDFLPSFRLSKILRFHPLISSFSNSPCLSKSCGENGVCQEIINSNHSSYFCSCHSGYYGIHCEFYDEKCNNYCSPKSICKPKHRGFLTGNQYPLCLCPALTFGSTCYIENNNCQPNPCMIGGTCVVRYNLIDMNNYICVCTDSFEGDHCQYSRRTVDISIMLSSNSMLQAADIVATTVSYGDFVDQILQLFVYNQQVYDILPSHLKMSYSQTISTLPPPIAIMKVYGSNYRSEESKYYMLYYQPDQKEINITIDLTSENHCPLVETLWHLIPTTGTSNYSANLTYNSTTAIFFYHHICRAKQNTNTTFTCFRDLNYLCICEYDHYRAECFGYNRSIDQCSLCLSNGYCLKGGLDVKNDFLCLCPRCYHGSICQYSTELMSYTLDSLIVKDIQNNHQISSSIYISIAALIFLFGFFNNLCSFLTFIRPKPRKFGVGNYLFIISIIDQCSLLLLLLKIIHSILGTHGTLFHYKIVNRYWCKIVSYLLSVFTRLTYWLTSFVTIERLCMVLFPTSITLKNPRLALTLSIFAMLMVSGMHIHEVLYYTTIDDPSYTSINITICVTNYIQPLVSIYNRVNVLLHYFVPFFIQVISITIMIIQTACSRARSKGKRQETFGEIFKKEFRTQKELYITPMIIILSSLPQAILSFSYACRELKQLWQRYSLLAAYFLSYLPQMLGFILYVLPSTTFSEEFRKTLIGKRLLQQQRQKIKTKTRPIKQNISAVALSKTKQKK